MNLPGTLNELNLPRPPTLAACADLTSGSTDHTSRTLETGTETKKGIFARLDGLIPWLKG